MACERCRGEERVVLPYGPHKFCNEHFLEFFEKRVKKTLTKFRLVRQGDRILVGVSGGKDSTCTAYLLHNIFPKGYDIQAVLVDEGIKGRKDRAVRLAKKNLDSWGMPYNVFSFREEYGVTMDEIGAKLEKNMELGTPCSFCGVLKRALINRKAKEMGFGKVATGHNLDDHAQSVLMNVFDNGLRRMAGLGPSSGEGELGGLVPRIKILYECPENEVEMYMKLKGIRYDDKPCPLRWEAKRNHYRRILDETEGRYPGSKYSVLGTLEQMRPLLKGLASGSGKLGKCGKCGAPSSRKMCMVCEKLAMLSRSL